MNQKLSFSLLQPAGEYEYRVLPDYVLHDLGLDGFLQEVSNDAKQRRMIANILSKISPSPAVSIYRQQIFADILKNPEKETDPALVHDQELVQKYYKMWMDWDTRNRLGIEFSKFVKDNHLACALGEQHRE